ncbi:GrpB family protein [Paenibacillus sp. FSL M8-0334]|uniref:GrpB family protein n=1 Tax=Paenibacillus sp. FSL M8-0334 TaxID=2921623 RepID=UPI0030FA7717
MLDETISLSTYQAEWKEIYFQEKRVLSAVFQGNDERYEHIGSTSIEGMVAKPIIDIMIGLNSLEIDTMIEEQLKGLGYEGFGEAGVPGRLYYRKRTNPYINLQVTIQGSSIWVHNILFRDYLRSHPEDVFKYSEVKQEIVHSGGTTLLQYSDEKAEIIQQILAKARKWSQGI